MARLASFGVAAVVAALIAGCGSNGSTRTATRGGHDAGHADGAPDAASTPAQADAGGARDSGSASIDGSADAASTGTDAADGAPIEDAASGPVCGASCPSSIAWNTASGATTDGGAADTCPAGQVLVGFRGRLVSNYGGHTWLATMQGQCAAVAFRWNGAAGAYDAVMTAQAPLSNVDSGTAFNTGPWTSMCPNGQVVIGYHGGDDESDNLFESLVLRCASLEAVEGDRWQLEETHAADLATIGANYPEITTELPQADCAAGSVVVGQRIAVGGGAITRVTLECASLSLVP